MGCQIPKPCAIGQITNLPLLTATCFSLRTELRYCRGCFITANRIVLTCALSTLKRACSTSSSYAAFYISILQKGFRYLPQPCSGAVLVLHSHDSRRCTGYANRYSRPAQPNPTQPNPTQPNQRIRLWPIAHLTLAAAMSIPRPTGKLAVIKQPAATLYPPDAPLSSL